jgi:multiple sugar transport system permease protein
MATLETAFTFNDFGLASAMAVILLMIIVLFMILQKVLFKEEA